MKFIITIFNWGHVKVQVKTYVNLSEQGKILLKTEIRRIHTPIIYAHTVYLHNKAFLKLAKPIFKSARIKNPPKAEGILEYRHLSLSLCPFLWSTVGVNSFATLNHRHFPSYSLGLGLTQNLEGMVGPFTL